MYETYVSDATGERRPPTIADIVRQKTEDGALIIDFFTDVMTGRVDDAKLCHRIDAAKQLVKYGHKGAADYIADHGDEPCDHCESRKRGPRSRKDAHTPGILHAQLITYDFINLLTEDFLTVLSAVDEDLMIRLVRAQTNHCETVVEFLDAVMYNRVDGFKANHRIAAARELISHIVRDEQRSRTPCPIESAPYSIRRPGLKPANLVGAEDASVPSTRVGAGFKPALPGAAPGGEPALAKAGVPEKCLRPEQLVAGTHPVAARTTLVPAKSPSPTRNGAGFLPQEPSPTHRNGKARTNAANTDHTTVVPTKAGTQRNGKARTNAANADHTAVVPAKAGTQGGGGARSTAADTEHITHVVPAKAGIQGGSGADPADTEHTTVVPAEAGEEPAPANAEVPAEALTSVRAELALTTAERSQLETNNSKLETLPTPGRSPPR